MIEPKIREYAGGYFIGMTRKMSVINNETGLLWKEFSPRIAEVGSPLTDTRFSIAVYPAGYFDHFQLHSTFQKWAAVQASPLQEVPAGMFPDFPDCSFLSEQNSRV